FFFCMSLRPRSSTLFPYTTLFRSDVAELDRLRPQVVDGHLGGALGGGGEALLDQRLERGQVGVGLGAGVGGELAVEPHVRRLAEDRKSTRLNSSHVKISYAVFCLK